MKTGPAMVLLLAVVATSLLFVVGGPFLSAAKAGDDRDRTAAARKLLAERGITCDSLAAEYDALVKERECLDKKYSHIETTEEAKQYVKESTAIREKVKNYEAKRGAFAAAYPVIPDPPKPLKP
ncbi:MAG: hypothetical protein AB1921_02520 [Thermodesulfobacteriota bacterium]